MAAVWWESGGGHGRCPRGELRFACITDAALAWPRHAQVCLLSLSCQPAAAIACTCRLRNGRSAADVAPVPLCHGKLPC